MRQVAFVVDPLLAREAEGVLMRRTIGSERLAILDPIMLLDHLTLEKPVEGRIGFPRHPHRGIETLSFVVDGRVFHKDSIGNEDSVGKDETQWMTAGRGIYHEEMLEGDADGQVEMLQLWFSLPRADKMIAPGYKAATSDNVPMVLGKGTTVRVIAGEFSGEVGPLQGIKVDPKVLQIDLAPGATVVVTTEREAVTAAYLFRGSVTIGDREVDGTKLIVLTSGEDVEFTNHGTEFSRLLFISAKALNEPIVQYRSFVMNSVEDIQQIEKDIAAGEFGQ